MGATTSPFAAMDVIHFDTAADFRRWLTEHGATAKECWVGFWRKDSGRGGLTYSEALDEALCFGWIDGVRKKAGPDSYTNRFTPRKTGSHWSCVNVKRVENLLAQKRMAPPGIAAFERRDPANTGRGALDRADIALPQKMERSFRAKKQAWAFFQSQPPSYRRNVLRWILSAKQEPTRLRRLEHLTSCSSAGLRLDRQTPGKIPTNPGTATGRLGGQPRAGT